MEPNLHTDADKYQAGMGSWSKTLAPLFIEFIDGIKEGDRVLDVGCDTGSLTFTILIQQKLQRLSALTYSWLRRISSCTEFTSACLLLKSGMLRNFPMTMTLLTAAYHH